MILADLQLIWYIGFIVLLVGYTILDGFDLGVGMMHLLVTKQDKERRLILNSIGPVWDGNEVWLVTAGGALFAGFPHVYATMFSAFYLPMMALLCGLIFRAVAIEFRSKQPMRWWRQMWDILFALASFAIAFGLGLVLGNLVTGITLDDQKEFIGNTADFFNPYALLTGAMSVALFAMHGAIYLVMKTEGSLHDKLRTWINPSIILFIILYATTTMATLIYLPHMTERMKEHPQFFLIALATMFAIANIPREIYRGNDGRAFISSCANIALLMVLFALGLFPTMLRADNDPAQLSLTVYNSSSSEATLWIMLIFALIGIPLVIGYTIAIYWIFRGKVRLESTSY